MALRQGVLKLPLLRKKAPEMTNTNLHGNEQTRGCILLFGLPRSGTTWLGKLFDSHPDTLYRHELANRWHKELDGNTIERVMAIVRRSPFAGQYSTEPITRELAS